MSAIPDEGFSWDDGWEHAGDDGESAWAEDWDDEGWTELSGVEGREGRAEWMTWVGQLLLVGLLLPLVLVALTALLIVVL